MGSQTPPRLPIIDFSKQDLRPGTHEWDSAKAQVRQALEEYGCFEALFPQVPSELRKAMLSAIKEFFELPLENKLKNVFRKPFHGYTGQSPTLPLLESMGINDATILEKIESFTNITWPEGNTGFCKTIHSFSDKLSEFDKMIRRMVLESLGVEKYMDEHMKSTNYLLGLIKYKAPQTSEGKIGMTPHKDKNIVTILYQNEVDGLEFQTKDGEWIHVQRSPGSFVVLSGDVFHAWTNGRVHSPVHRVMMRGNEVRYSLAQFSNPKAGYIVKTPEELVDEEHPLFFKPFDTALLLEFCQSKEGCDLEDPLKTYCGI